VENYSAEIVDGVNEELLEGLGKEERRQISERNEAAREEFYKIFGMNILG
jgi:broad-specificity NMP kinase